MCVEGGLDGRFSLWAGVGWWARGDQGLLSCSHLRTGWQDPLGALLCASVDPSLADGRVSASSVKSVKIVVGVCLDLRGL